MFELNLGESRKVNSRSVSVLASKRVVC